MTLAIIGAAGTATAVAVALHALQLFDRQASGKARAVTSIAGAALISIKALPAL